MKKLFSLLSVLMILFSMTSCKLLFDFRPSYLQTLKNNEAKVGNSLRVMDSGSDSRLVISTDDLDYGEYENNGEYFIIEQANAKGDINLGDKFISQLVEYDDLSDYVKSYINKEGYFEKTYFFQKGHGCIGNVDDVDDNHLFVEVNVYLKDNEPQYCLIVLLTGEVLKHNSKILYAAGCDYEPDFSTYEDGYIYYFNGDMTQVYTVNEINVVKFPDEVTSE